MKIVGASLFFFNYEIVGHYKMLYFLGYGFEVFIKLYSSDMALVFAFHRRNSHIERAGVRMG